MSSGTDANMDSAKTATDGGAASFSGLNNALDSLLNVPHIMRNVTHVHRQPAREARYAPFPQALNARLVASLQQRGVTQLYTHQADAIELALAGKDVVVVTPTASGKTVCFNVPVVNALLENPDARALYLYPTKALAQDQYGELHQLTQAAGGDIKVYTFDGDTPANARKAIRAAGQIVMTNPDMLHSGILPNHTSWIRLFERLQFVVIDEVHHYRGVFGSHVANVLRRLLRVCEFYGAKPQFICCSATIANPREIAEQLTNRTFDLVDNNGAPAGEKIFVFYNPPVVNAELGIRRGVVNETRRIVTRFLAADVQTIVFARSRMRVELLINYLKKTMRKLHRNPGRIAGYRGGYLPNERRLIEQGVKSGEILGVVSTNALELGIDIGQLRAAVIAGYPGSVASMLQQAGRAGRKGEAAVVVLIGNSSPQDQYLMANPDYLLGRAPEQAIVDPCNVAIMANHVKCAAFELPFEDGELFGGVNPEPVLQFLADSHVLNHAGGKWHWSTETYPSEHISLRSASAENFVVVNVADKNRIMAEIDYDSAPFLVHTEAIYMHAGEVYYIERLDWEHRTAYARPQKSDYYTDAVAKTDLRVIQCDMTENLAEEAGATNSEEKARPAEVSDEFPLATKTQVGPAAKSDLPPHGPQVVAEQLASAAGAKPAPSRSAKRLKELPIGIPFPVESRNFGEVLVSTVIPKYKKIRFETHETVGYGDIAVPSLEMQTECYWLTFRPELRTWMEEHGLDVGAALSGVAHVVARVVPLFVLCDVRDVHHWSNVRSIHDQRPALYLYDRYPGGIGLARAIFDRDVEIMESARRIVAGCACAAGCPACVGASTEISSNTKLSAWVLLNSIVGHEPDGQSDAPAIS